MGRTYGRIELRGGQWHIEAEPHVTMRLKQVCGKIAKCSVDGMLLSNTLDACADLAWFLSRYPMEVPDIALIQEGAKQHRESILRCEDILGGGFNPRTFQLAKPARDYQARAVEIYLARRRLIIGDELGLGKSLVAIAALTDPDTRPGLIVTLAPLPRQWEGYFREFAPGLNVHILKKGTPYDLPKFFGSGPDVLISSYHKLSGWANVLAGKLKSVCFDECQELCRGESYKYKAAKRIAAEAKYSCGLSGTPIRNYGGEFYNVADVICPGQLGAREEFLREWCVGHDQKASLQNPAAFGTYLRENFLFLRRTRQEVGRELPDIVKVVHTVDSDSRKLHEIKGSAGELARIILHRIESTKEERFVAAGQFDMLLRQMTGIAKAPYVADFVRILCESGEQVVVAGWHRECYNIWQEKLKDLNPSWYTGTETPAAKERHVAEFLSGRSRVMFMSLRAGQGLDGLQEVCSAAVIGELDWSPAIHDQFLGRFQRDGQKGVVKAYFLVSDDGADPVMCDILGIKHEQAEGIRNPERPLLERLDRGEDNIRRLAESFLKKEAK